MIKKTYQDHEWLEFELLQQFPKLHHRVTLRGDFFPLFAKQVHGNAVIEVPKPPPLIGDALATRKKNLPIGIKHADCQGAVIYDPLRHAAALVHSGWRGSVKNIYQKAIGFMQNRFNSNPADLFFCIGPSLGPGKAEFIHYKEELPEEFWDYQVKPFYFDFWEISKMQCLKAGILPHHLEIAKICTYENGLYSYRRDKTGKRHVTLASLL